MSQIDGATLKEQARQIVRAGAASQTQEEKNAALAQLYIKEVETLAPHDRLSARKKFMEKHIDVNTPIAALHKEVVKLAAGLPTEKERTHVSIVFSTTAKERQDTLRLEASIKHQQAKEAAAKGKK